MFFTGDYVYVVRLLLKQSIEIHYDNPLMQTNLSYWYLLIPQRNSSQKLVIVVPIEILVQTVVNHIASPRNYPVQDPNDVACCVAPHH